MIAETFTRAASRALVASVFLFHSAIALAIDPPKNPRGIVQSTTSVQWEWDWMPDAAQYEVTVDGQYRGLTPNPNFVTDGLWPGEHSLQVKAVDWNWQYSAPSLSVKVNTNNAGNNAVQNDANANQSFNQQADNISGSVNIPGNPRGTEVEAGTVQWQWDWTPDAASYEVNVDGAVVGNTTDTQFYSQNLWVGEHSMTVRAINAGGQTGEATTTIKVNVTGNASSGNNVNNTIAPPPPPAADDTGLIDPASYAYNEIYQLDGYELAFSDEFNGNSLNPNRWNTQLRWDGDWNGERYEYRQINGEHQFYVNTLGPDQDHVNFVVPAHNPFQFDGSRLAIRAVKNPLKTTNNKVGHGPLRTMVAQQEFLSGAIASYDKFTQKYGYFEARIKIPSHVGTFPAFWLHHQNREHQDTQRTEIDIMENLGHAPWFVYNSFHYFKNVSSSYPGDAVFLKPQPEGQIRTGDDFSQQYHTYAVKWEPGHIIWYIDGRQVSELYSNEANYENLYVILNLAMGGNWTNYPANSGGLGRTGNDFFPNQNDLNNFANPALEIDYVRVYKRK